jgi:hypothetical protein
MPNAILFAVVRFLETVVNWSVGVVLIAVGIAGMVAASRWLVSRSSAFETPQGTLAAPRHGNLTVMLAAVLVFGFGSILAGMSLLSR